MQRLFNILIITITIFSFAIPSYAFQNKALTFAQVTDLHFLPTNESINNYGKLIDSINKDKQIDFVVFTGDNIDKANKEILKEFLVLTKKLKVPYYIQTGNHDCAKALGLSKKDYIEYLNKYSRVNYKSFDYTIKKDDFVFVFVDGSKEYLPSANGYYKDDTLNWLNETILKYKKKNVIIFQHYPLYNISQASPRNTYKPELYLDLLQKHDNVKAIFSGHYHINDERYINGIMHITTEPAKSGFSSYRKIYLTKEQNKTYEIYSQVVKF